LQEDREVQWIGQREYARVEIDLPCLIDGYTPGQIHNISIGGALVTGPRGLADVDDTVSLEFKVGLGGPVEMFGEVLRVSASDRQASYGIEFVAVEPEQRHQLLRSIDGLLSGGGRGTRAAPRIHRQVAVMVRVAGGEMFPGTMSDISRGGLGLLCEWCPAAEQEITVLLSEGPLEANLELPGNVAHVHRTQDGMLGVGVRFARLSPQVQGELDRLVSWMAYAPR
jgi:hypothetical protein